MTPEQAIETIARRVLENARDAAFCWEDAYEDHPEIGESDWESIQNKIRLLTPAVSKAEFDEALALLAARATWPAP